jgi:hypothetical protein
MGLAELRVKAEKDKYPLIEGFETDVFSVCGRVNSERRAVIQNDCWLRVGDSDRLSDSGQSGSYEVYAAGRHCGPQKLGATRNRIRVISRNVAS